VFVVLVAMKAVMAAAGMERRRSMTTLANSPSFKRS
jgi:hypothetical protein